MHGDDGEQLSKLFAGGQRTGGKLDFGKVAAQLVQLPLEQDVSAVQQTDLVAQILQLPQVVGGNQDGDASFDDIVRNQLAYSDADDRVKPVECFIQQQIFGHTAHAEDDGDLAAHPLRAGG